MQEIINSFKNGEELFITNPTFNKIVYALAHGMTEHQAIEHLIEINESVMDRMKELLDTLPVAHVLKLQYENN
jgi:hypothetical protein